MLGIGDLVAARGAVAEAAATTLLGLLLDDVDDVDGDGVELLCGLMLAITKPPRRQPQRPNERKNGDVNLRQGA